MLKIAAMMIVLAVGMWPGRAGAAPELNVRGDIFAPISPLCEWLESPLGIDVLQPRLSWMLPPGSVAQDAGARQSAYQLLVASSRRLLDAGQGDLWDSGRVESDQSVLVPYRGRPLQARQECWWKVRIWDERQRMSQWSDAARWSMGLLNEDDWAHAKWIGLEDAEEQGLATADIKQSSWVWYPEGNAAFDAPIATRYFRRTLKLPMDQPVRRAVCLFAGDDQCVFFLNGTQIGISRGHPNLVGVDITGVVHAGANQLAVAATNAKADVPNNPGGWISALRIEFESGDPLIVFSDSRWKSSTTAETGWESSGYDDSAWVAAMELGKAGMNPWGLPWGERWSSEHRRLPARRLRREFDVEQKAVRRATAFVCGLGFFDLHVNGRLIGDQLMNPALTGYDRRDLYVTFDVTAEVRRGRNAIGVVLSNGRFYAPRLQTPVPMKSYGLPRMIARFDIEYEDGSLETIVSDDSWKVTADGPIRSSNEFDGEEYDARREMPGWDIAGFDDSGWRPAQLVSAPGGQLEAQMIEPIRVTETLRPVQVVEPRPGVWMVDFGQAFYGVVGLRVEAPAGTRISLRTSFNVLPDGTLNFHNDRSALNTDVYIAKGDGTEEWRPRFRGNATRWLQVEGFPGTPTADSFAGHVVHTDFKTVGTFSCSNETINRAYLNARWGTRMQNRSVPMEPDRDERMPWSGHPAKTSESEGWEFNVARFYDHFLHNYRAHQGDDGSLQEILPPYWNFNSKDIVWPSVVTIIPDWYYDFYGDEKPLGDNYEMMKRFVRYHELTNLQADDTLNFCAYGDWVDSASIGGNSRNFGATSRPLVGTAYFYHDARIVERAARILGHADDERAFQALADRVRAGFIRRFFRPESNTFESETQCSAVLPLAFGLVPEDHRQSVVDWLVKDILETHRGHTSVGLIGMQWEMQVLSDNGHPEVAYAIASQTDRPSWGYMISKGATTSWERWDTDTQDGGMNGESQKILSGNFEAWCYQTLAGIHYDREQPGFKHILLRPRPIGDLTSVSASFNCPYGLIQSAWTYDTEHVFHWVAQVPPNTTATLTLPTDDPAAIDGPELERLRLVGVRAGAVTYEAPPGHYAFSIRIKPEGRP